MATASGVHAPVPFLSQVGGSSANWDMWLSTFDTYIKAAGLTSATDTRRKALLLHCLLVEGQRVFNNLGADA